MGQGVYGGFGSTAGSPQSSPLNQGKEMSNDDKGLDGLVKKITIDSNADKIKKEYPLSVSGYFGRKGKNTRVIKSETPESTSIDFYKKIGEGGKTEPLKNGHGTMTTLPDGSKIIHRLITSTKGSPAVEIKIYGNSKVKGQKIHFIK